MRYKLYFLESDETEFQEQCQNNSHKCNKIMYTPCLWKK